MMRFSGSLDFPSGMSPLPVCPPPSGVEVTTAAASTPGMDRSDSATRAKVARKTWGPSYEPGGNASRAVTSPWGRKPGSTRARYIAVLTRSPAPTRRAAASATSTTTSPRRSRSCPPVWAAAARCSAP